MTDPTGTTPPGDDITSLLPYTPPPSEAPAAQRHGVVAALVVGIVGLLAAGVFALVLATGDGGSSTPEDAVQALLDAAAQEDVIGVLDTLAPAERRVLQQPVEDIAGELRRLGVLDDRFDLRSLEGLDLEFEGVEMASQVLHDDLAVVNLVSGTVRATTTPRDLPIGPVIDDVLADLPEDPRDSGPDTTVEDISSEDAFIATVREDGRWYVSLFYSVAEAARVSSGEPLPDFDAPVPARGAVSPAAAVEEMARAALALDARRLVELTPPDEMAVLHDYAPLFLDDAEAAVAELRAEGEIDLTLDRLDLETESSGDVVVVAVGAFAVSGTVMGEPVDVSYDGDCLRAAMGGDDMEMCADDLDEQRMAMSLPLSLQGMDMRVRTVQVGGEWYVSPTRTVLGALVDVLREIDESDLEQLVEAVQGMFFYGLGVGYDESGTSTETFTEIGEAVEGPADLNVAPMQVPELDQPLTGCWEIIEDRQPNATAEENEAAEREFQMCMEHERAAAGE